MPSLGRRVCRAFDATATGGSTATSSHSWRAIPCAFSWYSCNVPPLFVERNGPSRKAVGISVDTQGASPTFHGTQRNSKEAIPKICRMFWYPKRRSVVKGSIGLPPNVRLERSSNDNRSYTTSFADCYEQKLNLLAGFRHLPSVGCWYCLVLTDKIFQVCWRACCLATVTLCPRPPGWGGHLARETCRQQQRVFIPALFQLAVSVAAPLRQR